MKSLLIFIVKVWMFVSGPFRKSTQAERLTKGYAFGCTALLSKTQTPTSLYRIMEHTEYTDFDRGIEHAIDDYNRLITEITKEALDGL